MLTWQETVIRLFIAAVLGGLIGLDRSRRDLGAGLRTHMLVSVGSTLLMLVSNYGFSPSLKPSLVVLDPSCLRVRKAGARPSGRDHGAPLGQESRESGINGPLPTSWVPSIYSVSPLPRS